MATGIDSIGSKCNLVALDGLVQFIVRLFVRGGVYVTNM